MQKAGLRSKANQVWVSDITYIPTDDGDNFFQDGGYRPRPPRLCLLSVVLTRNLRFVSVR